MSRLLHGGVVGTANFRQSAAGRRRIAAPPWLLDELAAPPGDWRAHCGGR
jgi:hypothetical protein